MCQNTTVTCFQASTIDDCLTRYASLRIFHVLGTKELVTLVCHPPHMDTIAHKDHEIRVLGLTCATDRQIKNKSLFKFPMYGLDSNSFCSTYQNQTSGHKELYRL